MSSHVGLRRHSPILPFLFGAFTPNRGPPKAINLNRSKWCRISLATFALANHREGVHDRARDALVPLELRLHSIDSRDRRAQAVITVPAYFSDAQRSATRTAGPEQIKT